MLRSLKFLPCAFAVLLAPAIAWADGPIGQNIDNRLENQQDRVGQGIDSGSLTAGEAAKVETQESALTKRADRIEAMKAGPRKLVADAREERALNRESRRIYRLKHN